MRVLITGASGFVGKFAAAELASRGAEVITITRRPDLCPSQCTNIFCDIFDRQELARLIRWAKPDILLHLAWNIGYPNFWTAHENLHWVSASLHLLECAQNFGIKKFVGVGTCFEYQWPDSTDCDELTTPLIPTSLYAISKDATRRIAAEFAKANGIDMAWARLFYLYGPGEHEKRLVASIANNLARGIPAHLTQGLATRDFLHVQDAGRAMALLTLSDVNGSINIASGNGVSVREIAERLGNISGRPDLIRIGSLPDRSEEPARIVGANRRLITKTGFSPNYDLEIGLRDVYEWWKNRL